MRRKQIILSVAMAVGACSQQDGDKQPLSRANHAGQPSKMPPDPFGWPILDRTNKRIGTVTTRLDERGVQVTVETLGLPPGVHGVHIHEIAKCELPAFASAGGHWNWTSRKHGHKNPQGHHAGDLGNLSVGADGKGNATFVVPTKEWDPEKVGGLPIVIHAAADDELTDPSGNSGERIACGILYLRRD